MNTTATLATITEWVSGGQYAVAVEVEAQSIAGREELFLTPSTVRRLERIAKAAREGDLDVLKQSGKVYVQLENFSAANT